MPYRRGRRRTVRAPVQSFKKVINIAPASVGAAANNVTVIATGVDSVAAGQTSAIDSNVPTGSIIKYIEVHFNAQNLVNVAAFMHIAFQYLENGQSVVSPNVVGGSPQRNQVLRQDMFSVGQNQNVNRVYRFMIPKKFQRVREGRSWRFVSQCDQISTQVTQCIYKFYR